MAEEMIDRALNRHLKRARPVDSVDPPVTKTEMMEKKSTTTVKLPFTDEWTAALLAAIRREVEVERKDSSVKEIYLFGVDWSRKDIGECTGSGVLASGICDALLQIKETRHKELLDELEPDCPSQANWLDGKGDLVYQAIVVKVAIDDIKSYALRANWGVRRWFQALR